jgi:hypothetical protein
MLPRFSVNFALKLDIRVTLHCSAVRGDLGAITHHSTFFFASSSSVGRLQLGDWSSRVTDTVLAQRPRPSPLTTTSKLKAMHDFITHNILHNPHTWSINRPVPIRFLRVHAKPPRLVRRGCINVNIYTSTLLLSNEQQTTLTMKEQRLSCHIS